MLWISNAMNIILHTVDFEILDATWTYFKQDASLSPNKSDFFFSKYIWSLNMWFKDYWWRSSAYAFAVLVLEIVCGKKDTFFRGRLEFSSTHCEIHIDFSWMRYISLLGSSCMLCVSEDTIFIVLATVRRHSQRKSFNCRWFDLPEAIPRTQ